MQERCRGEIQEANVIDGAALWVPNRNTGAVPDKAQPLFGARIDNLSSMIPKHP
jgi:hypothetical protein